MVEEFETNRILSISQPLHFSPMPKGIKKPKIPRDELSLMRVQFEALDLDGNGELDWEELAKFMDFVGMDPKQSLLAIYLFDENDNGTIDFDEFTRFADLIWGDDEYAIYRLVFHAVDREKRGYLDKKDLVTLCHVIGYDIMPERLDTLFAKIDDDGSGKLEEDEVIEFLEIYLQLVCEEFLDSDSD